MNIGDRVRLIHGKEEGRITRLLGNQQLEIEIADGFRIPVLRNEVVIIAAQETKLSKDNTINLSALSEGVYLAWIAFNDKLTELFVINDTSSRIFFSLHEVKDNTQRLIHSGIVNAASHTGTSSLDLSNFDNWPVLQFQVMYLNDQWQESKSSFSKKIKLKASAFFNNKSTAPLIGKPGYVVRTDQDAIQVSSTALEAAIVKTENNGTPISKPEKEVDLHIEKLHSDYQKLSNSEMLRIQLDAFEKNFDNAIASGMDQIVFIHGIGNGILKKEIHKKLSGHKHVAFFQDAQKEKFGYGATLVKLK